MAAEKPAVARIKSPWEIAVQTAEDRKAATMRVIDRFHPARAIVIEKSGRTEIRVVQE